MLITNGNLMWGTVHDDIRQMALELNIGDCITFGTFIPVIDSSYPAIRFPMLWHVIDKTGNKIKLLSYFFFEHTDYWSLLKDTDIVTWENSEVRHKLNNIYYHDCFNEYEKNAILSTEVITKTDNSSCITTNDKLYIPSLEDIENIPDHLKIGRCLSIEHSVNDIAAVDLMYCFYWLRDPGENKNENLVVQGYANSKLVLDSLQHYSDEVGVRAVMWIDAEKI